MGINPVGTAQPQPKSNLEKAAILSAASAVGGAAVFGGTECWEQKRILKDPAKALADAILKKECTDSAPGNGILKKYLTIECEEQLKKVKNIMESGKMDLKALGKITLAGSAVTAAFAGIGYFIGKTIFDMFKGDK